MPADVDQLLRDASRDPTAPLDADALWASGRRRRRRRQLGAVASGCAAVAVVAGVAIGLAVPGTPTIEPVAPDEEPEPDDVTEEEVPEDEAVDDPAPAPEDTDDADDDPAPVTPEAEQPAPEPDTPEPDPAAVADPCAAHDGREAEAFIDVVAPIGGQHVDGPIELVGCSNVPEATVRYRVLDAGGEVHTDTFTTAECGSGCVGEFREFVVVEPGEVTLQVFWDSPADGAEQDLVEIEVVVE